MISDIFAHHPWLWPLAWQSTLCLAAGLGGSLALRKHAVRAHQVLLLGLVAAVLIPALSQVVKQNQWGLLVAERAVATPEHRPLPAPADFVIPDQPMSTEPASPLSPTRAPEAAPAPARTQFEWARVVLPAWLSISSVLLLRLVIQFLLGRRLAKWSEVVDDVQLRHMIEAAKSKLGIQSEVGVRASAQARSPVIWCWGRRPVLLVPPAPRSDEGLDWPSILCHELAHAKRHDHVSGLLAELLVCGLPWQPLAWWTRQRLAALSEQACDDWVIACGQRATGYARTLLGLTTQGQAAFLPGVVTSRRGLAGRVHRILEDGCGNPRPGLRWTLTVVALAGGVSLSLAFAQTRPAPRAGTEAKSSAASREQLDKILDAMLYHDRAVFPIALHADIDLYNLDAPADSQHNQTYVFDQRLDGKRLDSLMNVYRLRDGEFHHDQVNRSVFTGAQFLYRQQQVGSSSSGLTASLDSKEKAVRIMAYDYIWGCTLFGHLPGDEKPVASLLKDASDVVLQEHREDVDGVACHVIEGRTDHGTYKLWVDPEHDYRIRRAVIDKGPDDVWYGKPVSTPPPEGMQDYPRISVHVEISDVHLEKIDGHFIPTVESETATTRKSNGKEDRYKVIVKRSQIDLKPDFEKLGAFVMDGIPEGTAVWNSDPNDHTYAYEWHNGKAVSVAPDGGIIVGRFQLAGHADLRTLLTDRRRFEIRFTLVSTTERAGAKRFQNVTLTPGKNGAFQVKDVPPGAYRLQLALTDLIVEKLASGGHVPRDKILAEAERDVTIPEGKDAARKTVDLGVIEMTLADTAESPGGTDAGKGADAARGTAGRQAQKTEAPPQVPAAPLGKTAAEPNMVLLRLIDPNGRPVAGAKVGRFVCTLTLNAINSTDWQPTPELSDENGQVVLDTERYLPGRAAMKGVIYILHEQRNLGAILGFSRGDAEVRLPVVLQPVCRVHGTVESAGLAALGMPLRRIGVNVFYRRDHPPALLRGSNRPEHGFEFLLPPGTYELSLWGLGCPEKEKDPPFLQATTGFQRVPITVPAGQPDLDVGMTDIQPGKWATLIGQPAPELGPIKEWKNGSPVTLADLRGQFVWLRFARRGSEAHPNLRELVGLQEVCGARGLTTILISNWSSLNEFEQRWRQAVSQQPGGLPEIPFRIAIDGDAAQDWKRPSLVRIGATFERYGIEASTDLLIDPAGNVIGEPDVFRAKEAMPQMLAAQTASSPPAGRKQFDEVYRLADGELLKRIAPPYLPERMEHYPGGRDRTMPRDFEQKLTMVFLWDGQLKVWGATTSPAIPLGTVLSLVLRLSSYEYEGPKALLDLRLPPGDWIIRDKVSPEVKLRALEELVARELERTVRFEKRTVKRETLIATGRFQFHPPVGTYENTAVHLYATVTDPTEGAGGGTAFSVGEFLQKLGNVVHMPVINQAEPNSPLSIPYRHHRSAFLREIEGPREKDGELKVLLEHLTAQTELQFEIRKEPVDVWFVTE
jgi:beta-lactamase regulating signal transducer with metallopeptidase domain